MVAKDSADKASRCTEDRSDHLTHAPREIDPADEQGTTCLPPLLYLVQVFAATLQWRWLTPSAGGFRGNAVCGGEGKIGCHVRYKKRVAKNPLYAITRNWSFDCCFNLQYLWLWMDSMKKSGTVRLPYHKYAYSIYFKNFTGHFRSGEAAQ
jgi:hypothetical protein